MKVYKVKLKDANYYLEPVFNSREVAVRYSGKYTQRNIEVEEYTLNTTTDHVYRIKYLDDEGYFLGEDLYESLGGYNHPQFKETYYWYINGKPQP